MQSSVDGHWWCFCFWPLWIMLLGTFVHMFLCEPVFSFLWLHTQEELPDCMVTRVSSFAELPKRHHHFTFLPAVNKFNFSTSLQLLSFCYLDNNYLDNKILTHLDGYKVQFHSFNCAFPGGWQCLGHFLCFLAVYIFLENSLQDPFLS